MEKAGIWQTFLAPFQPSVQLTLRGTHGVIHISFLFTGLPLGSWPVFALYLAYLFQKIFS